jgi:hypothetical protein
METAARDSANAWATDGTREDWIGGMRENPGRRIGYSRIMISIILNVL